MRLSQNEIIQAGRKAERFKKTALRRAIVGALMLLPIPVGRWALTQTIKLLMHGQGYTANDMTALIEDAERRKRDGA